MNEHKTSAQTAGGIFGVILLVLLDQFTKFLAYSNLKGNSSIVLIPGVFELHYLENQSAAFSIDLVSLIQKIFHFSYFEENPQAFLACKMYFFIILTIIVILIILRIYRRIPSSRHYVPINAVLILFTAGAVGNLIDRIVHHFVIDFLYFSLINFPIFNVADIYVTCGAAGLILCCLFLYKESDFEAIFPTGKEK